MTQDGQMLEPQLGEKPGMSLRVRLRMMRRLGPPMPLPWMQDPPSLTSYLLACRQHLLQRTHLMLTACQHLPTARPPSWMTQIQASRGDEG